MDAYLSISITMKGGLIIGWGGFSVYRKIPAFLKNRFFGFANVQIPKKVEKPKKAR
jgi:hypothetical protein